ncbi:hypothetical protein BDV27DRAFT_151513 [Aspergillus caelatus]|uniref:Patatin-like phospholipase n=1 Tax=Aspergillus caelatus TaxID=61420 RepID=A0A5N6ZK66_9EURO|nr:uncharacterized protein BDV27DRAFT_151513 [Aspergillus caelatus]KAE8357199.1 hypothetical protein BDV27DRAFT_151513 [Aspergillus caelatus]
MCPKTDTSWLDVGVGENGSYVIRDYGRLDQVVSELTQPRRQHPFLSVFLGGKNKDIALQAIFPQNNIRRTQPCSRIGLRYDITSSDSESPILFADGNVTPTKSVLDAMPGVYDYPITWPISSIDNTSRLVYTRLIFLFADLVCLFADDFPDLMSVAHFLVDCVSMRSASAMPVAVRPRVLVVLMGNPDRSERNGPLQQFYQQLYEVDSTHLSECFFNVNLVYLDPMQSESIRYDGVRTWILNQRENIQIVHRENWSQVNAVQLGALFTSAIRNLVSQNQAFFDFVNASREWNPVGAGLSDHVAHFLEVGHREECKLEILLSSLASALILDHCLPGMMLMDPYAVFRTLYHDPVLRAFCHRQTPRFSKSVPDLVSLVEQEFVTQYHLYASGEQSSIEYRRQHLLSTNYELCRVQSDKICLYCLVRTAQHSQVCCHTICDLCPQLFGNTAPDAEYQFSMVGCLLCNSRAVTTIDVLPPTMNPTVLAIDGGGVRGGIPLEYLLLIQESLGPECKLADLVDLAVGSSSGEFRLSIPRSLGSLIFLRGVFFASVDNPLYRGYFA